MEQTSQPKWVKLLRVLIWIAVIVLIVTGVGLRIDAERTSAYITGTHDQKIDVAKYFLIFGVVLGVQNLTLGVVRWLIRKRDEKWSIWKIIGKIVGGGIWRILVIAPAVIVSLMFFPNLVGKIIENNVIFSEQKGIVSADGNIDYASDILEKASENLDQMSLEEIKEVLRIALLSNVDFDIDASTNVGAGKMFLAHDAFASSDDLTVLNKAKLSKLENFVIFYTDVGDSAISDGEADMVANMLEEVIASYKTELNLSFNYKKEDANLIRLDRIKKVLAASGVDINALDFAMPVYIVNPFTNSDTLASYAGVKFNRIGTSIAIDLVARFGKEGDENTEQSKLYSTAATFPFINILPENINSPSLKLVTAHELGHHYADTYCIAMTGKYCDNHSTMERKIYSEGLANWLAATTTKTQPEYNVLREHHETYIKHATCEPPDKIASVYEGCIRQGEFLGYPLTAFLTNVAEIFGDGENRNVLMESLNADYFLEDIDAKITSKFGVEADKKRYKIMQNLAERNLTNDYGNNYAVFTDKSPTFEGLPCLDFCSEEYSLPYATLKYFVVPISEYRNKKIIVFMDDPKIAASFVAYQDGKKRVIESTVYGDGRIEYQVDDERGTIFLAVANSDFDNSGKFKITIEGNELGDLLDDVTDGPDEKCIDLGGTLTELIDGASGLMHLDFLDGGLGGNFSGIYAEELEKFDTSAEKAKATLGQYSLTLCQRRARPGVYYDEVFSALRKLHEFEVFHFSLEDEARFGVSVGMNFLSRTGKIFVVIDNGYDDIRVADIVVTQK